MMLGEKLQKLRKARGWSQEELAGKIEVSRQAISRWESGETLPDAANLLKLSDLFGVTSDYLLRDEETGSSISTTVIEKPSQTKKFGIAFWGKVMMICSISCFAIIWLLSTFIKSYENVSWVENGTHYFGSRPGYSLFGFIDVYHLAPIMWVLFFVAVAGCSLWKLKDEGIQEMKDHSKNLWNDNE